MWQIVWDPVAARQFDRLPEAVQERIYDALLILAVHGRGEVKRLRGQYAGTYRLRVGDYRLRFELRHNVMALLVLAAETRGDAYRD